MKNALAISLIVLGLFTCVGLGILTNNMIWERYKTLRTIGEPKYVSNDHSDGHLYKKYSKKRKKLGNKYGRGTGYDRAKLRYNRFQKNYV